MSGDPQQDLATVDEILQLMFWLQGEALASAVDAATLVRFLPIDASEAERLLNLLVRRGLLESAASGPASYALTGIGRQEAARRFADEFADMTKPGHGECADPDCDCHRTGSAADCRYRDAGLE